MIKIPYKITLKGDKVYARNFIGAAQSQMRILENQLNNGRLKQGARRTQLDPRTIVTSLICFNLKEVVIDCLPRKRVVERKKFERLPKRYIYVTISKHVTIWSLETGEVAEDVCDNDGNISDDDGNPLITFPCHRDKLKKWLEKFKNKPTRQWLKDEPEHNRDYVLDNQEDIGDENRVEKANRLDPSYDLYYGIKEPCVFTNTAQDVHEDTDPTYPYEYPRKVYDLLEKDTPDLEYIVNCEFTEDPPEDWNRSFSAHMEGKKYLNQHCFYKRNNNIQYYEPYQPRSKELYLGSYPSPSFQIWVAPGVRRYIGYSLSENSPYKDPIVMKSSVASFSCYGGLDTWDWWLKVKQREGDTASFSTVLGDLIINYNSVRDLLDELEQGEELKSLYDIIHEDFDIEEDCFSLSLRDGTCSRLCKYEENGENWYLCESLKGQMEHATEKYSWCWTETLSGPDTIESESNRYGVSWCGSPYNYRNELDEEEREEVEEWTNNRNLPENQKSGWYRVLLRFYMGGFHTSGRSGLIVGGYHCCPPIGHNSWVGEPEIWENELKERFSYVQPTIELEKPEDYAKEIDKKKYERPEDYDPNDYDPENSNNDATDGIGFCMDDKKYSTLCAFPGRDHGYYENEENEICYPFDGTYVLHSLGEAIEELINEHYEDGSDDQLIVYLMKG